MFSSRIALVLVGLVAGSPFAAAQEKKPLVTRERVQENAGWPLRYAAEVEETPAPTADELMVLRELNARTARAHGDAA